MGHPHPTLSCPFQPVCPCTISRTQLSNPHTCADVFVWGCLSRLGFLLRFIVAPRAGGCQPDTISPLHTRAAFILVFVKR